MVYRYPDGPVLKPSSDISVDCTVPSTFPFSLFRLMALNLPSHPHHLPPSPPSLLSLSLPPSIVSCSPLLPITVITCLPTHPTLTAAHCLSPLSSSLTAVYHLLLSSATNRGCYVSPYSSNHPLFWLKPTAIYKYLLSFSGDNQCCY